MSSGEASRVSRPRFVNITGPEQAQVQSTNKHTSTMF